MMEKEKKKSLQPINIMKLSTEFGEGKIDKTEEKYFLPMQIFDDSS